ncbi:hypothetical protein JL720_1185 [Aureococcus anophagefferens]|nr:hypothetical protein JL720_1185 [Aureococcus anophagefferens]
MLLGSHRRGLAAPAPRAVAPTAPPPMAETPPKRGARGAARGDPRARAGLREIPGEEAWWGGLRRREKVLVLSPVRRTNARRQKRFVKLLLSLDWDRRDLSVATLVSPDSVAVCEAADAALRDAKPPFASVTTYLEPAGLAGLNTGDQESGARHKLEHQLARRSAIARARNHLAVAAVGASDAEWVLWLDNDLLFYGADLLLQLRASDVDVVVPTCYCSGGDACGSGVYDRNSWAETPASAAKLRELDAAGRGDALVVHGYGAATATAPGGEAIVSMDGRRRFLDDLRTDALAPLVPLGGVGATCILLRADLVREGLSYSIVGRYRQSERIVIGTYSTKAKVVQNSKLALDALSPWGTMWRTDDVFKENATVDKFSDPPDTGKLYEYQDQGSDGEVMTVTIEKVDLREIIDKPYVKPEEPEYEDDEIPWLSAADVEAWSGRSRGRR